jgi:hypothetical protein
VGIETSEILLIRREAFVVPLSDLPPVQPAASLPGQPWILAGTPGTGGLLFFPSYGGTIMFSLDGGSPQEYKGPLALPARTSPFKVAWSGAGSDGMQGLRRSIDLDAPFPLPQARISGPPDGSLLADAARFYLDAPGAVRYELSADGSIPPEPGIASSLLEAELVVDCARGEEKSFVLRYRGFTGFGAAAEGGESNLIRFKIDRRPPAVPEPESRPPSLARSPQIISFPSTDERLMVSIAENGAEAPFLEYKGPLALSGSRTAVRPYLVRAYSMDRAGNQSPEMAPLAVTVDLATISVDSQAAPGGDGSLSRPFASLESALAAAREEGRRLLLLKGDFVLKESLSIEDELVLDGSSQGGGQRASLTLAPSAAARPSLLVRGASLSLRGLRLQASGLGTLVRLVDGELALRDVAFSLSSPGDLSVIRAEGSRLSLAACSVEFSTANALGFIDAESSEVEISSTSLSAREGVSYYGGLALSGGSLVLTDALMESAAPFSSLLMRLRGTRIEADRSLFRAEGGGGFLRLGLFEEALGEIRNSRVQASWGGDAVLFEYDGTGPAFIHDTIEGASQRGLMSFFSSSASPPSLWNSIIVAKGGRAELLRAEGGPPGAGSLVADCLWGFERLVSGVMEISSIAELDRLNAASPLFSSTRHVSEAPSRSFAAPVKNLPSLRRDSACVDAAMPLPGSYGRDFRGQPRPSPKGAGLPDIGADESQD